MIQRRQLLKTLVAASLFPSSTTTTPTTNRFCDGAARIPGVTLHTPRDPALSAGISCFEVRGLAPGQVVARLAEKKLRTTTSPYKVSYARVSAGIMNKPEEIDVVLREIKALT